MAKDDKQYVANWLISGHKGKDFQAGDVVSLPDEEAAPLLACGALSVKGEDAAASDGAGDGEQSTGESAGA